MFASLEAEAAAIASERRTVPQIEELNIGHAIVARAVLVGMERAVREMRDAMTRA